MKLGELVKFGIHPTYGSLCKQVIQLGFRKCDVSSVFIITNNLICNQLRYGGKSVQISDVAKLPQEAATEKAIFQSQSIRSVLVVPTIHAGRVVGFFGTDVVNFSKIWNQEDINLLQRVGELIAIGRFRHQAEEALRVAKVAAQATIFWSFKTHAFQYIAH